MALDNQDRIKFESENHFFYFNKLKLKDEYKNTSKITEIVEALDNFFDFKVTEIVSTDKNGKPTYHYRYDYSKPLPPDKDMMTLTKCFYSDLRTNDPYQWMSCCENILGTIKTERTTELKGILSKYFLTYYTDDINNSNNEIKSLRLQFDSCGKHTKFRKSGKLGKQWALPHQDAYGSDIEKALGEALEQYKIDFIKQQEIFYEGKLLTVLDIFMEKAKLAIYCDGFQYHYDKETVIKDRTQDRILQLLGYKVLRYTGSEIKGNLRGCVSEIRTFIAKFSDK